MPRPTQMNGATTMTESKLRAPSEYAIYATADANTDNCSLALPGELTIPSHYEKFGLANGALLRSCLFGIANKNIPRIWYRVAPLEFDLVSGKRYVKAPRFECKPLSIKSLDGVEITYAGEELRQDDLSVALFLVSFRQLKVQDKFFDLSPYSVVRELGWSHNKESVRRLAQSIVRMGECFLTTNSKRTGNISGAHLIDDYIVNMQDTKRPWKVKLGSTLPTLLEGSARGRFLRLDTRRELPAFAQWMYGFIATQNKGEFMPKAIPLGTLFRIAGMNTKQGTFHENRRKVKEAMELLESGELTSKNRGPAVAAARKLLREFRQLDREEAKSKQSEELRQITADALCQARTDLAALERTKTTTFTPGVAPGWQLTGSTLNFMHV